MVGQGPSRRNPVKKPTTVAYPLSGCLGCQLRLLYPKQWNKVKEAIANPEDMLIVEGWQAYDDQLKGIAVWAINVTTKALQRQKREAQP